MAYKFLCVDLHGSLSLPYEHRPAALLAAGRSISVYQVLPALVTEMPRLAGTNSSREVREF